MHRCLKIDQVIRDCFSASLGCDKFAFADYQQIQRLLATKLGVAEIEYHLFKIVKKWTPRRDSFSFTDVVLFVKDHRVEFLHDLDPDNLQVQNCFDHSFSRASKPTNFARALMPLFEPSDRPGQAPGLQVQSSNRKWFTLLLEAIFGPTQIVDYYASDLIEQAAVWIGGDTKKKSRPTVVFSKDGRDFFNDFAQDYYSSVGSNSWFYFPPDPRDSTFNVRVAEAAPRLLADIAAAFAERDLLEPD